MILLICSTCNSSFRRFPSQINTSYKRGSKRLYCSRQCASKSEFLKNQTRINGLRNKGRINIFKPTIKRPFYSFTSSGYKLLHKRFHPTADKRGNIMEHRWIMEQYIGRLLKPEEKIHHKNGNKLDNRIENLELHINQSSHIRNHKNKKTGKFAKL